MGLQLPCFRGAAGAFCRRRALGSTPVEREREALQEATSNPIGVTGDAAAGELAEQTSADANEASARPPCLACGGAGCGICKMTHGELEEQFASSAPTWLCGFFPVRDELVEELCRCPLFRKAQQAKGSHFVDLGCGDGRVVIEVVQKLQCRSTGVEIDGELKRHCDKVADEQLPAALRELAIFTEEDFRNVVLRDATAVFLFLPQHVSEYVLRQILPTASLRSGMLLYIVGRKSWRPALELAPGKTGCQCRRLATYVTADDSFGTLHCLEWRNPQSPS